MLPFLRQPKAMGGVSVEIRKPDSDEPSEDAGLEAAASDLIDAVHAKDTKATVAALRACYDLLEAAEPHQEEGFDEGDTE